MKNHILIVTSNPAIQPDRVPEGQADPNSAIHKEFAKELYYCVGQIWNRITNAVPEYDLKDGTGELTFHMFSSLAAVEASDKELWKTCRMVVYRSWNAGNGYSNVITRDAITYLSAIDKALKEAKNDKAVIQVI